MKPILLFALMVMGVSTLVEPKIGEAYLTEVTSTDLISYWEFEETSSTRFDSVTTTGNDLTDNNTVGYTTGIIGNGADFEQSASEYFSLADADNTGIHWGAQSYTFNFWQKLESNADGNWFTDNNQDITGCTVYYATTNQLVGFCDSGGSLVLSSTINTGTWYMISFVYDYENLRILFYKNGTWVGQDSITEAIVDPSTAFRIGVGWWTGLQKYYDGVIDEFSVWNTALGTTTLTELYNSGAGLGYDSLFEPVSTTTTSTTTSTVDVEELKWVLELYLSVFTFLIFTYLGYRFTKMFI